MVLEIICCGQKMKFISDQPLQNINKSEMYLCFECGSFRSYQEGQLDEEELQAHKENFIEE